jgi:hypothetical protein
VDLADQHLEVCVVADAANVAHDGGGAGPDGTRFFLFVGNSSKASFIYSCSVCMRVCVCVCVCGVCFVCVVCVYFLIVRCGC